MIDNIEGGGNYDFCISFPPLGHPEHHFNKYPEHPWLRSKESIKLWLMENLSKKSLTNINENDVFMISEELVVTYKNNYNTNNSRIELVKPIDFIPVQFGSVKVFKCSNIGLKSLIGTPYNMKELIAENNNLESLEGLYKENVLMILNITSNRIKNLKEIEDIMLVDSMQYADNPIESLKSLPIMESIVWFQDSWKKNTLKILSEVLDKVSYVYFSNGFIFPKKEDGFILNLDENGKAKSEDIKIAIGNYIQALKSKEMFVKLDGKLIKANKNNQRRKI